MINEVKGSIEMTSVVMQNIGSGVNETVAAYKKETYSFASYFHIIEEVMHLIYRTFFQASKNC